MGGGGFLGLDNIFGRGESKDEKKARKQAEENLQLQRERLELEKQQLEATSGKAKEAAIAQRRERARRMGRESTDKTGGSNTPELQRLATIKKKRLGESA